ncbi:hypothetical protein CKAH01_02260 [Colletotrichum kahawae]|uniref:Uncharacterized protein n=1 Tax=Colletotrichum kahawae TaxID=34407 RepID=A0AAE0CZW5_COLKA|nr:hypothetical protein CKAH01_02260 [Colletotrichum kahawae]
MKLRTPRNLFPGSATTASGTQSNPPPHLQDHRTPKAPRQQPMSQPRLRQWHHLLQRKQCISLRGTNVGLKRTAAMAGGASLPQSVRALPAAVLPFEGAFARKRGRSAGTGPSPAPLTRIGRLRVTKGIIEVWVQASLAVFVGKGTHRS